MRLLILVMSLALTAPAFGKDLSHFWSCVGGLSNSVPTIRGYFTGKPTVGSIILNQNKAYAVEEVFTTSGAQSNGAGFFFPERPTVRARELRADFSYSPEMPLRQIALTSPHYKGDTSAFFVIGQIQLEATSAYSFKEVRRYQFAAEATNYFQAGDVILRPGSDVFEVIADIYQSMYILAPLHSETMSFKTNSLMEMVAPSHLMTARKNGVGVILAGRIENLSQGSSPKLFDSWDLFLQNRQGL